MGHFLNFGAAQNQLPPPWQNLNAAHDIRKPLKFEDGSASFMFAEHVLEHVPFLSGLSFVNECFRVLEPKGVLRLSFPDPARFIAHDGAELCFNSNALTYARELAKKKGGESIEAAEEWQDKCRAGLLLLLAGWGHQCAWTLHSCAAVLLTVGFEHVRICQYGATPLPGGLANVDGHHLDVGRELAILESSILEAVK